LTQRRRRPVADDAGDMGPAAVVVHRAAHCLAVDRERGVAAAAMGLLPGPERGVGPLRVDPHQDVADQPLARPLVPPVAEAHAEAPGPEGLRSSTHSLIAL